MIRIRGLKLYPGEEETVLKERAAKKLRVPPERIQSLSLIKRSLDARRKDDIHYICAAAVSANLAENF